MNAPTARDATPSTSTPSGPPSGHRPTTAHLVLEVLSRCPGLTASELEELTGTARGPARSALRNLRVKGCIGRAGLAYSVTEEGRTLLADYTRWYGVPQGAPSDEAMERAAQDAERRKAHREARRAARPRPVARPVRRASATCGPVAAPPVRLAPLRRSRRPLASEGWVA